MADANDTAEDCFAEDWRSIEGWEGFYSVSTLGRIRRDAPGRNASAGRTLRGTPCKGYVLAVMCDGARRERRLVHRLVATAFIGECPPGNEVNHLNGVKDDNRRENLEYVTRSENGLHASRVLGKNDQRGERNPAATLSAAKVLAIRERLAAGASYRKVAAEFCVSRWTVGDIALHRRWAHL